MLKNTKMLPDDYGFVGNVFLKVKILKGLTFTPRLSIDYKQLARVPSHLNFIFRVSKPKALIMSIRTRIITFTGLLIIC